MKIYSLITIFCCFLGLSPLLNADDFKDKTNVLKENFELERRVAAGSLDASLKILYDEAKEVADIDQVLEIRKIQKQIREEDYDIKHPSTKYKKVYDTVTQYKKDTLGFESVFLEEILLLTNEEISSVVKDISQLIDEEKFKLAQLLGDKKKLLDADVVNYKKRYDIINKISRTVEPQKPERPNGFSHRELPSHIRGLRRPSLGISNSNGTLYLEGDELDKFKVDVYYFHGMRNIMTTKRPLNKGRNNIITPKSYFDRIEIELINSTHNYSKTKDITLEDVSLILNDINYSVGKNITAKSQYDGQKIDWSKAFNEQAIPYYREGKIGLMIELLDNAESESFVAEKNTPWVTADVYEVLSGKVAASNAKVIPPSNTFNKEAQDAMVIVKTNAGSGSGFLGELDGKTYIFTNQHVIQSARSLNFTTTSGIRLKPKLIETALNEDIVRVTAEIPEAAPSPLKVSDSTPRLGAHIMVMGNSQGAGVATLLNGTIKGVGADRIEVSAKFVPGNSGSPIINNESEVVGIATYIQRDGKESWINEGTRFTDTRRFGFRFHDDIRWIKVNPRNYFKQGQLMSDTTLYIKELLQIFPKLAYYYFNNGGRTKLFIDGKYEGKSSNYNDQSYPTKLKSIYRSYGAKERVRMSPSEIEKSYRILKNEMVSLLSSTSKKLKTQRWYNRYLKNEADDMAEFLDGLVEDIDSALTPKKSR